jgi:lysozyme
MLKSVLRPETIARPTKASLNSFGSFMTNRTGGAEGVGTFNSKNNIVKFDRINSISPLSSDINNLVSNISTNIINSVDKSVKNITYLNRNDINSIRNDIYSKISELSSNYETIKSQVDLTSLKVDDAINITKEQNLEQFKVDIQRMVNNIQERSDKSDVELQKRIEVIQNDINSLANVQTSTNPQVEAKTSATWIQSIATNIKNEVDGILQNTLRNFSEDYNKRAKNLDDTRPNNILSKFASLYQNAIGFITYFGNDKNIKVVQDNLKSLRKLFIESFEVSKVLRQTIVKIVKQLSNLPSASPNSGGLDLNISVPGGKLRQSAGPAVRNVGRGARIGSMLGVGALGLGGAATAMSGMQSAKQFQEEKLAEGVSPVSGGEYIPENLVENFSSIVERFSSAVDNLINGIKKSSGSRGGEGGAKSGGGPPAASPGTSGGVGSMAVSGTPEEKALLDAIAFAEGTTKSYGTMFGGDINKDLESGNLTVKQVIELGDEYARRTGVSGASGRYQFMPFTLENLVQNGVLRMADKFTPEMQDMAALWLAKRRGVTADMLRVEGLSANISNKLAPEWASFPTLSGRSFYGQPVKKISDIQEIYKSSLGVQQSQTTSITSVPLTATQTPIQPPAARPTPPSQPRVEPAPARAQQIQARAQAVSTPAQRAPETITLSPTIIDATQTTPEPQGGGVSAPPQSSGGSIEVPFLPTTNPDNFLTMYSRIVYNIVDG